LSFIDTEIFIDPFLSSVFDAYSTSLALLSLRFIVSWSRQFGGSHGGPRCVRWTGDGFFVGMTDGTVWMSEDGGESFRQILSGLPEVVSLKVVHR
jgi:hypothetical protein